MDLIKHSIASLRMALVMSISMSLITVGISENFPPTIIKGFLITFAVAFVISLLVTELEKKTVCK